ncbi:hypothetical protein, partial [Actinocorallia aurantiaca]|uniref:hypothetical protein n=1 Tax=Actinocorallia aurantiaca TaxID=46204 RepID=UPI0031CF8287
GAVYAQRHERMRKAFLALDDDHDDVLDVDDDEPFGLVQRHLELVGDRTPATAPATTGGGWADPQELRRRARASYVPTETAERVVTAERVDRPEPAPVRPVPPFLAAAIRAFGADTRMHSEDLAAALGLDNKHRLAELLGGLGVSTLPNAFERNGRPRRGYEKAHLLTAAEQVQAGRLDVPDDVRNWAA